MITLRVELCALDVLESTAVSLQREISILDYNDNPPVFENGPYTFHVDEDTTIGTTVYKGVLVTDADLGINADVQVTCQKQLTPKACSLFALRQVRLGIGKFLQEIVLDKELDYEEETTYVMSLLAIDLATENRMNSTADVIIKVRDVQDQPPVFVAASYSATVSENSREGTSVLLVSAHDADAGVRRQLSFKLLNDTKGYFRLGVMQVDENGVHHIIIETSEVTIDREDPDIEKGGGLYNFQIEAVEVVNGAPKGEVAVVDVNVVIMDDDDQLPEFNSDTFSVSVPEDIPENSAILGLNMIVNDNDVGDNAKFSLHLRNINNSEGVFSVYPSSAVGRTPVLIKVADASHLDYENESQREFVFYVVASQHGSEVSSATVTITLSDANDNSPVFENDQYLIQVPENARNGTSVFSLVAYDADSGQYGRLSYAMKGYGSERFIVEKDTGQIRIGMCKDSCLDFETVPNYSFTYEAQDGGGKVSSVNLFIQVVDVNDNAPKFTKDSYLVDLMEDATEFASPVFVKATDIDGPSQGNGRVRYWLKATNLSNPEILSIDPDSGQLFLLGGLNITAAPYGATKFIVIIQAIDYGDPPLASDTSLIIRLKIPESDQGSFFSVSPISGAVTLNQRLDYEDLPEKVLAFDVKAVIGLDKNNQRSSIATVIINVQDINDNSPVFSQNSYVTTVSEATKYPQTILHIAATDKDTQQEYGVVWYSISGEGTDVVIKIQDENDNAPEFSQSGYTAVVPENVPTGFSVLTVKATDKDSGVNSEISYSFVDEPELEQIDLFAMDDKTGVISVIQPLSGRGRSEPYFLTVRATDAGSPQLSTDVKILIIIGDVSSNDGIPRFIRPRLGEIAYVHENVTIGTSVFQVQAVDPDNALSSNGQVAYKFLDKHSAIGEKLNFEIDLASGLISTTAILDREKRDNYTDAEPVVMKIKEELPVGSIVGKVKAFDRDMGTNAFIDYFIVGGNLDNVFAIQRTGNNEGEIITKKRVDREAKERYMLTLKVRMPSKPLEEVDITYNPDDKTQLQVDVQVEDIDDNSPSFEKPSYVLGIRMNTEINSELLVLKARDPDSSSSMIMYSIRNVTYYRAHILHDSDLMKFIFYKQPQEIRKVIPQFEK
ncbi:hypothetical protein HPB47_027381 [Ixodes persulcatus]|uniref:Uncharacterized protein n=1 Tax=Ixodes persulcatus TaxID=34615 RepID=A0AC60PW01_IXOPE|nr:hypothetical protein HPB47_027381 [Ixodes persulcatus]